MKNWHRHSLEESTDPDGFFLLVNKNKQEGRQRKPIFLEVDLQSETIEPGERVKKSLGFWKGSSLLRKFVVYHFAQESGVHVEEFGVPVFQVLTVTTTPDRVQNMIAAVQNNLAGRPHHTKAWRFLFTDFETIDKHDCLLDVPIFDGSGKELTLRTL